MEKNKIILDLNNIKTYTAYGVLNKHLETLEYLTNLSTLDKKIYQMKLVRCALLEKFKSDLEKTFRKYNSQDVRLEFNPKKLFQGNYLDLSLINKDESYNILISKNKIENASKYSSLLDEKINQVYKYIEALYRVFENSDTNNIVSNSFYETMHLTLSSYQEEFLINGDGVRILPYNFVFNLLSEEEQLAALKFFYDNRIEVLEKIFLTDDKLLDNYRLNTSKRRVLSLYKRGK